jgi:arsenite/tail-anchored protein-transporting ATPase
MMGTMMQDLAFAIPGVDEAMSFAEIMKYVTTTPLLCAPFLRTYGGRTLTYRVRTKIQKIND